MATANSASLRFLPEALRLVRPRPRCQCLRLDPARQRPQRRRNVSTAAAQFSEMEVDTPTPRWAQTPPAMRAPFPIRPRSSGSRHDVNKDPRKLDDMYVRFLGRDGPTMLSDESKWLAVTHKSFDHGRRGFNDRLAYLGKRIVELQASLGLISISEPSSALVKPDAHGREPFAHPATDAVECLSEKNIESFTHHKRMSKIAEHYGIPAVTRWSPKNPDSLTASGADTVYAQSIYAIVGAIALERGGAVANRIARERVLQPLGIGTPQGSEHYGDRL